PHQRFAAGVLDGAGNVAAALHVENNGRTRLALQDVLRIQDQLPIGPDDFARRSDHAKAVGIAVESQAKLAVVVLYVPDKVLQVVGIGRVGVVVGEGAVDVAVQFVDLATQCAVQARSYGAAHAIAAVDGDFHGTRKNDGVTDVLDIGIEQLQLVLGARLDVAHRFRLSHDLCQLLYIVAVQGLAVHHHLEAVVVGRIVAAGDRDARAGVLRIGGKIDDRSGHHAQVYGIDATLHQAILQALRQFRTA